MSPKRSKSGSCYFSCQHRLCVSIPFVTSREIIFDEGEKSVFWNRRKDQSEQEGWHVMSEADIPTRSRPLYGHTYSKSMDQPGKVATGKPYDREISHVSADWCKHKALSDNII